MAGNLAPAELFNPAYGRNRINLFLKKYTSEDLFTLTSGRKVRLLFEQEKYNVLNSVKKYSDISKLKNFRLTDKFENEYSLSNFMKTPEFGGGSVGSTSTKVKIEKNIGQQNIGRSYFIESLRINTPTSFQTTEYGEKEVINTINSSVLVGGGMLSLKIKNNTYNIIGAAKVPGNVKADIALIDEKKQAVCFISHKLPSFSSYGGVTDFSDDAALVEFAEKISERLKKAGQQNARGYYGKSQDSFYAELSRKNADFLLKTVYGKNYSISNKSGIYNVDYVVEGLVKIDSRGVMQTIPSPNNIHPAGDIQWLLTGDNKAVLFARFDGSAGRGLTYKKNGKDVRIENLRFSIAPITATEGRKSEKIFLTN
jgi:hypothetical protein